MKSFLNLVKQKLFKPGLKKTRKASQLPER
ncbi:Uncharacterised protein [Streptococcus pyogenes]|nr:Uncharacterised protein [Streptococcus pyogenes]VHH60385.1 Uncharacterised protein [Streptococcus pyogenes]VHJ01174.1 Uncharacterised protein [Streptococcus pyogenes]